MLIMLFLFIHGSPQASDNLLLYGTELSSESDYVYLGTILPFQHDQHTYFLRLWSDGQRYEYENGVPRTIKAESRNLQLSIGTQFSHYKGWLNLYLGYARNNTKLDPDDPANQSRGRHTQALLSFDGEAQLDHCDHQLIYGASYLFDQNAYWARVRPICWTYNETGAGFELVTHGDQSYNHLQLGGVLYNRGLSSNTSYTLKAGITSTQDSDQFPYLGIEFTTRY